jgi:hypothetical protein
MNNVRTLVSQHPEGIPFNDLLHPARAKIRRTLTENQLRRDLEALGDDVELIGDCWRLRLTGSSTMESPQSLQVSSERATRVVAVDCESVVRQVQTAPEFIERHLYQIGAQRIGLDSSWVESDPDLELWIRLAPSIEPLLGERPSFGQYQAHAGDLQRSLERYASFITDADFVVAYNGTRLDFPLLEQAFESVGLAHPRQPRFVDALYLAYALWPTPPNNHWSCPPTVDTRSLGT